MKNSIYSLLTLSAMVLVAACTPADRMAPGSYEKTSSSTDANGTTVTNKTKTDVTVDEYGNKKAVVKKKTTTDPKGLMNKRTSESEEVYETK